MARHGRAELSKADLRKQLTLPAGRPLALVSFGGYGLHRLPLDRLDCLNEWDVVLTSRGATGGAAQLGIHVIPEERLYGAGLGYEDLVRAVDVVISKPGYGIVADCVANETAMVYTSRGRFAEYGVMVAEMPRYRPLRLEDFEAGRWREALADVAGQAPPPERPRTDGARVAAEMIAERVSAP